MNKKKSKHLLPSEEKALHYIIEHGSTYAYELGTTKKILGTEKTANIALNNLARRRLLHKKAKRGEETNRRERQMYTLSLRGLCVALIELDLLDKDPDWIKKNWGHLLPLLNKLPLFDKNLFWACLSSAWEDVRWLTVIFDDAFTAIIIEEKFCKAMYRVANDPDSMTKIDKILHADPEFRKRAKDCLHEMRARGVVKMIKIGEWINRVFPELEKSEPDWNKIKDIEKFIKKYDRFYLYDKEVLINFVESHLIPLLKEQIAWKRRVKLPEILPGETPEEWALRVEKMREGREV